MKLTTVLTVSSTLCLKKVSILHLPLSKLDLYTTHDDSVIDATLEVADKAFSALTMD